MKSLLQHVKTPFATTLLVSLSYPIVIQIASKLCGHDINGFMAFWLAVSSIGFFMTDCRKSLKETSFYRLYCNRSQFRAYVPPEDYSRGLLMTAIQSFIYSAPLVAMGLMFTFDDNGLKFFWGMMLILATIYGNIGVWHNSKNWEIATWKQFAVTCWIPLPMLLVVTLWLMIFDVRITNEVVFIMANMVSSGLSVLATVYIQSCLRRD